MILLFVLNFFSLIRNENNINFNIIIDEKFVTHGILNEKILFYENNIVIDSIKLVFIPGEIILDSSEVKKIKNFKGVKKLSFSYQDPNNNLHITPYLITLEPTLLHDYYEIYYIYNMRIKKYKRKFNSRYDYVCEFKNQTFERREATVKNYK